MYCRADVLSHCYEHIGSTLWATELTLYIRLHANHAKDLVRGEMRFQQ